MAVCLFLEKLAVTLCFKNNDNYRQAMGSQRTVKVLLFHTLEVWHEENVIDSQSHKLINQLKVRK